MSEFESHLEAIRILHKQQTEDEQPNESEVAIPDGVKFAVALKPTQIVDGVQVYEQYLVAYFEGPNGHYRVELGKCEVGTAQPEGDEKP